MEMRTILHVLCTPVTFILLRKPFPSPLLRVKDKIKMENKLERMGEKG